MSIRRTALVLAAACAIAACTDPPPPGADLVLVSCNCSDTCAGDSVFIQGEVCTESSKPANVDQARKFICDTKETVGFNVCKIENCVPSQSTPILDGCPADNGDFHAGDFALATAGAVEPSIVHVGGDDIIDFSIAPDEFVVTTTRAESTLFFGSFVGSLGTTEFESDGIFHNANHTLTEGRISGGPFAVAIDPDGSFSIPPGMGNFIITGKIDGDRLSLTIKTLDLHGHYDEELGVFDLKGTVKAQGADISLSVDLVFDFVNRPPRANAGPDQTIECDDGQQTGVVHLSGTGFDLDGVDDVARFSWFVDDGPEAATGPEVDVPVALGDHEVKLAIADRAGSFGADGALVRVQDTQAPEITVAEPRPIEYSHSETIVLDYGIADTCAGVDGFAATIDGAETLAGHGLESGQPVHLLTELSLGAHTFAIQTSDAQGNASSSSFTFVVVATPESIQDDVRQFVAGGQIADPNQGGSLLMRLRAAAGHYGGGNCRPAIGIYESFINTLDARRGKSVDPVAADIMTEDARFLIEHCPEIFGQAG
jgi:hypothetical protein